MVVQPSDLKWYNSGGGNNNSAAGGSQGGSPSTVEILQQDLTQTPLTPNTKWTNHSSANRANGKTDYRCWFLKNTHATQTASNIKVWIDSQTPGPDDLRIGYSGKAPNVNEVETTSSESMIYDIVDAGDTTLDADRNRRGIVVAAVDSVLYGEEIKAIEVYLAKQGSPTGTLYVRIRRPDDSVAAEFGSKSVSGLSTSLNVYRFENDQNTYNMEVDSKVSIEYDTSSSSNIVLVGRHPQHEIHPGANFNHEVNYDGTQWRNVADYDIAAHLYIGGSNADEVAPSGISFQNPNSVANAISLPNLTAGSWVAIWGRRTLPAGAAQYNNNSQQIQVRFDSPDP